MVPKGIKYGWYGGTLGGYLFLPIVAAVFMHTGFFWHGVLCLVSFAAGIGYSLFVTPWKYPDAGYGKLLVPLISPIVLILAVIVITRPEYQGQAINVWQFLFMIPMFIMPVILTWKHTYNTSLNKSGRDGGS